MHAITKYIAGAYAFGVASGFTLKELLSFVGRKLQMRRERRIDDRVVKYLIHERNSCPLQAPNAYGQQPPLYYRSSRQIADALDLKSVDILQRLERLETEKRVKRPGTKADQWTATENELHDEAHRRRRFSRLKLALTFFKSRVRL
jgi:hypothetical protein